MAGCDLRIYNKDNVQIDKSECWLVDSPFEFLFINDTRRFDTMVNEKLKELETMQTMALKYYKYNSK
jgi:hypothetical protein